MRNLGLTLLIPDRPWKRGETTVLCPNQILVDPDYGIFGQLIYIGRPPTIKPTRIPNEIWIQLGTHRKGINLRNKDNNGFDLTYVTANELKKLKLPEDATKNKAMMAYINALEDDTPIILLWT